ncbi:hypothetical protein [Weissella oryzae]|uniref:hypothetical protein n=1 Tax=Weissella oryzae TaxID=1129792 RepID=UPI000482C8B5|nr:hypothetical protein [Weissella oryzae]
MIIGPDRLRKPLMFLWLIIFLIVGSNLFLPSPLLNIIDNFTFNFQNLFLPTWLLTIAAPFTWFSHGFGNAILIFLLIFLLWGFKYKIPAAWLLLTNLSGWLLISMLTLLLKHHIAGGETAFPNVAIFFTTLLITYLYNIVLPELTKVRYQILLQIFCILTFLTTIVYEIGHRIAVPTDLLAGWLLALIWLSLAELMYVKYAKPMRRRVIFRNSWY